VSKKKLLDLVIERFNIHEKEAVGLIMSGNVLVNEKAVTKTGIYIDTGQNIRIINKKKYVSRGAYKLLYALEDFNININNFICTDIGSSTGGFTQVLLKKGAKKVYAVDCGINQLDYTLRKDPRVVVMENTIATDLTCRDFCEKVDLAVIDVSFTSSIKIIYHLIHILKIDKIIVLIKPQFEYDRLKNILNLNESFNGIVKNDEDLHKIIDYIIEEIKGMGLNLIKYSKSSIKGTKGNREYLFYILK